MRFVMDTSSLVNLRDLRWLNLLRDREDNFFVPNQEGRINQKDCLSRLTNKEKKFSNRKQTLRGLVLQSLEKERKLRVAKLYQKRRKTLRQCAEMLSTDVEGMMKILYELDIPLSNGSANDILKNLKMIREQQPSAFKASLTKDG